MSASNCAAELPHTTFYRTRNGQGRIRTRTNRRTVTMPERVGPHVKLVFAEMARLQVTYDETEEGSGVRRASIKAWRRKNRPGLESLEAVLGWLGWDLVAVPRAKTLPPRIAADLTALATKMRTSLPDTWDAVVAVGVAQEMRRMSAAERGASLEDCIARMSMPTKRRKPTATVQ